MTKDFEIHEEVTLAATPEQVWESIATGDGLAAWFQPADIRPDSAMVVDWKPTARLVTQMPGADPETTHRFEWIVDKHDDGTRLRFVHSGVERDDWDETFTAQGWAMYLATLREYLAHFAGRPATYLEAEGPPSSADPDAWRTLLDAVGLVEPVQLGDEIHIDLAQVDPAQVAAIAGTLDYVTPHFVGLRSGDALIRFHGRAPVGLPVAVSHHDYRGDIDATATTRAWEAWLGDVFAGRRAR
ncbi:MAG: SRPBCC family protein [Acidimicrobiales bacterium]